MDVVKPSNLNIEFLREFMMLPTSYFAPGAALKFRKIYYMIQRLKFRKKVWGPKLSPKNIRFICRGLHSTLWNSLHQGREIRRPTGNPQKHGR